MLKKIGIGLIVGFISGLLASGGGMILLPASLYIFKLNEKEARATTIFSMLIIIIATSIIYSKYKNFDIMLGIKCAVRWCYRKLYGNKIVK
ncbi:MAG: sulfite exporter TauE/SafE family protein [Clostridia bacterium]|nr:sulfite exporter TauE/SafE family protein [Clostridia bacterium]